MNTENTSIENSIYKLTKELRITRFFCILSSLLTLFLLIGGFFIFRSLEPFYHLVQDVQPVLQQFSQLDIESFNQVLSQIDVEGIQSILEQIDTDAINSTLQGLDIEEFSTTLKNLNDITEVLRSLSERFNSFLPFSTR